MRPSDFTEHSLGFRGAAARAAAAVAGIGLVQVHHVDVGAEVQLATTKLAHAEDDQAGDLFRLNN